MYCVKVRLTGFDRVTNSLEEVLRHPGIWRGKLYSGQPVVASGYPWLDELLPGGGWPIKALTEILVEQWGIGELRLLVPALAHLTTDAGGEVRARPRWIAWVAPPFIPYAPALVNSGVDVSRMLLVHPASSDDALWAVEQALRSGTCAAVLAWIRQANECHLRRLQLAAETGNSWGVLFRSSLALRQASPAALRLKLAPAKDGLDVHIIKSRGGHPARVMISGQ